VGFGGVAAEEFDGLNAVGCEVVVDVVGEVLTDGYGSEGNAGSPFVDEVFDVGEAMVAGVGEVLDELRLGDVTFCEGFGADGPYGGDPGESGAGAPLVGKVEPLAGADGVLDLFAVFECEKRGVADKECGVGLAEHGYGIGR